MVRPLADDMMMMVEPNFTLNAFLGVPISFCIITLFD